MPVERIIFHSSFDNFHLPFRKNFSSDRQACPLRAHGKSPISNGMDVPNAKEKSQMPNGK